MIALGIVIGFIVGALALGWPGGIAGAFVGFIVMLAWRSRAQARVRPAQRMPTSPAASPEPAAVGTPAAPPTAARLAAIEQRLAVLEARVGVTSAPVAPAAGAASPPTVDVAGAAPAEASATATPPSRSALPLRSPWERAPADASEAALPAGFVRTPDGTLAPVPARVPPIAPIAPAVPRAAPAAPNPLWAWFTGGNALTRIGVLVLFFGVAFLLREFARLVTIPIEAKLLGVALVGGALVALGLRLARARPGYGLSLEGAGAGILYLTTFAAFRLYDVLPAVPAFALLVVIAVGTVWLAMRADSQALAALAIAGGFLAPFLVATSAGAPARLFGYFAVLNA
ncbi:MAG: DUF2339 domain-containing protein, partial [Betaproteobacteria bacterium]